MQSISVYKQLPPRWTGYQCCCLLAEGNINCCWYTVSGTQPIVASHCFFLFLTVYSCIFNYFALFILHFLWYALDISFRNGVYVIFAHVIRQILWTKHLAPSLDSFHYYICSYWASRIIEDIHGFHGSEYKAAGFLKRNLMDQHQCFGETTCFHHQDRKALLKFPENSLSRQTLVIFDQILRRRGLLEEVYYVRNKLIGSFPTSFNCNKVLGCPGFK
jgi:hypothetical protein